MTRPSTPFLLRLAGVLTLVGLSLFVWAVLDPRPAPVLLAMSIGQGLGALAFAAYLLVVVLDLRKAKVLPRPGSVPPRGRDG